MRPLGRKGVAMHHDHYVFAQLMQRLPLTTFLRIQLYGIGFPMRPRSSVNGTLFVRLATYAGSFRRWAPAGNVKRLLPPRQSRGIPFVSLAAQRNER